MKWTSNGQGGQEKSAGGTERKGNLNDSDFEFGFVRPAAMHIGLTN